MYTFFFFFHGSHFQVLLFCCVFEYQNVLPTLQRRTYFMLSQILFLCPFTFANEFQLKVTLCNNDVRRRPLAGWLMQQLSSYCWFFAGCQGFFAYQVCIVIIKPTGTIKKINLLHLCIWVSPSCWLFPFSKPDWCSWMSFLIMSLFLLSRLALNGRINMSSRSLALLPGNLQRPVSSLCRPFCPNLFCYWVTGGPVQFEGSAVKQPFGLCTHRRPSFALIAPSIDSM